jgi:hypothetical protein
MVPDGLGNDALLAAGTPREAGWFEKPILNLQQPGCGMLNAEQSRRGM